MRFPYLFWEQVSPPPRPSVEGSAALAPAKAMRAQEPFAAVRSLTPFSKPQPAAAGAAAPSVAERRCRLRRTGLMPASASRSAGAG